MGEFGDKFRKEREKKGISLDDVSNVTKIGSRMLKAIEDEQFDQLPGGVFNKGFIRAYAKHLGLDDAEAVTAYLAALREAQITAETAWEPEHPAEARAPQSKRQEVASTAQVSKTWDAKPQTPAQIEELPELQLPRAEHVRSPRKEFPGQRDGGIPWRIVAVAVVVLVLGVILWNRHSHRTHAEGAAAAPAATTPVTQPAISTATAENSGQSAPAIKPQPNTQTNAAHPSTLTVPKPTDDPKQDSLKQDSAKVGAEKTSATTPPASSAQAVSTKPAATLTLVIRASENSWISVSADGQLVNQETLIAPANTSIRASREIVVRAGNAAGVSFLWNGHEIPAQGARAEAKTFIFDATGMRELTPAPARTQNQ